MTTSARHYGMVSYVGGSCDARLPYVSVCMCEARALVLVAVEPDEVRCVPVS